MSEYQYYEFLALDRPLTDEQRTELGAISSQAEITATRFVNEYEWGDPKGDPQQMVERYLILSLYLDRDPDHDWQQPDGELEAMVQARVELAAGDLRLLYLAWRGSRPEKAHWSRPSSCAASGRRPVRRRPARRGTR